MFRFAEHDNGINGYSEEIKKREYEYPDQIDKVPEKARYLDAIGKMFRVALVKLFTNWQPHVDEDKHACQYVKSVQPGDREIAREICIVRRQKHRCALDVFLFDRCN